jgi:uncharacterized protein YuzE
VRLEYDLDVRALYITLSGSYGGVETRDVDDNTLVDTDTAGNVIGVEVISVDHSWPLGAILRDYAVGEEDTAQLRAYFQIGDDGMAQPVPVSFEVAESAAARPA